MLTNGLSQPNLGEESFIPFEMFIQNTIQCNGHIVSYKMTWLSISPNSIKIVDFLYHNNFNLMQSRVMLLM